jgi:hypothetical protein
MRSAMKVLIVIGAVALFALAGCSRSSSPSNSAPMVPTSAGLGPALPSSPRRAWYYTVRCVSRKPKGKVEYTADPPPSNAQQATYGPEKSKALTQQDMQITLSAGCPSL